MMSVSLSCSGVNVMRLSSGAMKRGVMFAGSKSISGGSSWGSKVSSVQIRRTWRLTHLPGCARSRGHGARLADQPGQHAVEPASRGLDLLLHAHGMDGIEPAACQPPELQAAAPGLVVGECAHQRGIELVVLRRKRLLVLVEAAAGM
jgi:hypothetical protein